MVEFSILNERRPKPSGSAGWTAETVMHFLEPGLKRVAFEMGYAYIQPTLSKEAVELIQDGRYAEFKATYKEMLIGNGVTKEKATI